MQAQNPKKEKSNVGPVGTDPKETIESLLAAVEAGKADAQYLLGMMHERGVALTVGDPKLSSNMPPGSRDLPWKAMQLPDFGITPDPKVAYDLFSKAARQGHHGAQFEL